MERVGAGAAAFVIGPTASSNLTITDFTDGVDRIDLTAFGFDSQGYSPTWADFLVASGADTIFDFYGANGEHFTITLQGFDYTNINPSDHIV